MMVRKASKKDLKAIEALHKRMGFNYLLPAFDGPPAVMTKVVPGANGVLAATHLRKEAEWYLWLDSNASARARWEALQALDRECCPILKSQGFDQTVAWIPMSIEWEFSHALVKLGFRRARASFAAWSKELS